MTRPTRNWARLSHWKASSIFVENKHDVQGTRRARLQEMEAASLLSPNRAYKPRPIANNCQDLSRRAGQTQGSSGSGDNSQRTRMWRCQCVPNAFRAAYLRAARGCAVAIANMSHDGRYRRRAVRAATLIANLQRARVPINDLSTWQFKPIVARPYSPVPVGNRALKSGSHDDLRGHLPPLAKWIRKGAYGLP